jgi:hypothetical protein
MKAKVVAVLTATLLAATPGLFAQGSGGRASGGATGAGVPAKDGTGAGAPTTAGTKAGTPAKAAPKKTAPKGPPAQALHEPGTGLPK